MIIELTRGLPPEGLHPLRMRSSLGHVVGGPVHRHFWYIRTSWNLASATGWQGHRMTGHPCQLIERDLSGLLKSIPHVPAATSPQTRRDRTGCPRGGLFPTCPFWQECEVAGDDSDRGEPPLDDIAMLGCPCYPASRVRLYTTDSSRGGRAHRGGCWLSGDADGNLSRKIPKHYNP